MLDDFGGIAKVMPKYALVWGIIMLSSVGLPGLNGFVGEFLILVGAFQSEGVVVQTATGTLAWAGIGAAGLVAIGAILLLAVSLGRQSKEQVGTPTKLVTIVGAVALALLLVCPPVFGFGGGLLIRPLVGPSASGAEFREIFALLAVIAGTGVIFAAVYLLLATQKVFFGPVRHPENETLHDLTFREGLVLAPLVLCAILIGVYPQPFLNAINPTVASYAQQFRARAGLPAMTTARAEPRPLPRVQPTDHDRLPRVRPTGDSRVPPGTPDLEALRQRTKAKARMLRAEPRPGVPRPTGGDR